MVSADSWRRLAVGLGLMISAFMVCRAQVGGDQLNLLSRGWLLVERGVFIPYGNPLSSGGDGPGIATTLAVAGPLWIWRDHRAPVAAIWILHAAAWVLLDRRFRQALSPWERAAFAVVYWLNPWRLEGSAYLWNPNFLFFAGALHFATAFDQRQRPRFMASFLHLLALGIGAQLHPAMLLLIVASVLLWQRGVVRVHWGGVVAGGAVTLALLVPWWQAIAGTPSIVAASQGFLFRGLLLVQPWIKGLSYWLRLPSLLIGGESSAFDFSPLLGAAVDRLLTPVARGLVVFAGGATLIVALAANIGFLRRRFAGGVRAALARSRTPVGPRQFVEDYAFWCLLAAVVVFAMIPTTPQGWQAVPLMQAAVIPIVLWWGRKLAAPPAAPGSVFAADAADSARVIVFRRLLCGVAVAAILLDLSLAVGGRNFRCGGRRPISFLLRASSPMFEDLGLQRTCPWQLNVPNAWWPDVLPEE